MKTFDYDFINRYNAHIKPSTVHSQDNATSWYFRRYLIQKILSVFKFEGIPETWSIDYFLYTLFVWGFIAVVETDFPLPDSPTIPKISPFFTSNETSLTP